MEESGVAKKMVRKFSGHALHDKALQKQMGVGLFVSSQKRRALSVPRINCSSTAGFVPIGLHRNSVVRASQKTSRTVVLDALEEKRARLYPGRTDLSASRPAPARPAPPSRRAPPHR